MTEKRACRVCGRELVVPAAGRPPMYCSTGCRRSVEYEITRANRRDERLSLDLDRLDRQSAQYEAHPPIGYGTAFLDNHWAERAATAAQLADAEARIRHLLDTDD